MSSDTRRPASEVIPIAQSFLALLQPHAAWIEIAGSLRRGKADVGDVDIVAVPLGRDTAKGHSLALETDALLKQGVFQQAQYARKGGFSPRWGLKLRGIIYEGVKFELAITDEFNAGYIFWLRTGPDSGQDKANTYLMSAIKRDAPFKCSDGYVWQGNNKLLISNEADWFALCGLPFIAPHERSLKAYHRLLRANHRWGNPQQYAPRTTLFDLDAYLANEDRHLDSGVKPTKPPAPPWQWQTPFLTPEGYIWVYADHGRWALRYANDEATLSYLARLRMNGYWKAEAVRLNTWLDLEALRQERDCYTELDEFIDGVFAILDANEELVYG